MNRAELDVYKRQACAYAHFLAYGLKLKEREEYRFEAMDLGNICLLYTSRCV